MSNTVKYGGDMMLFVDGKPLAFSTNATLNMSTDTRETSTKDSEKYKTFAVTKYSWDASSDVLAGFDVSGNTNGIEELNTLFVAGGEVDFAFASHSGTSPSYTVDATQANFVGKVLITSMSITGQDADNLTASVSLQGTGALTLS